MSSQLQAEGRGAMAVVISLQLLLSYIRREVPDRYWAHTILYFRRSVHEELSV